MYTIELLSNKMSRQNVMVYSNMKKYVCRSCIVQNTIHWSFCLKICEMTKRFLKKIYLNFQITYFHYPNLFFKIIFYLLKIFFKVERKISFVFDVFLHARTTHVPLIFDLMCDILNFNTTPYLLRG